jgi:hypothetical protein
MFEPKITIENDWTKSPTRWLAPQLEMESHHAKATADIKARQARALAHEEKQRAALDAAEKAKGKPLTQAERLAIVVG